MAASSRSASAIVSASPAVLGAHLDEGLEVVDAGVHADHPVALGVARATARRSPAGRPQGRPRGPARTPSPRGPGSGPGGVEVGHPADGVHGRAEFFDLLGEVDSHKDQGYVSRSPAHELPPGRAAACGRALVVHARRCSWCAASSRTPYAPALVLRHAVSVGPGGRHQDIAGDLHLPAVLGELLVDVEQDLALGEPGVPVLGRPAGAAVASARATQPAKASLSRSVSAARSATGPAAVNSAARSLGTSSPRFTVDAQ